jgi:NAD(P)-dependent dehydrogenase (short-subunit alcohol dehydrogenase family)
MDCNLSEDLAGANIEDTTEEVTARGGIGIPIRCDHGVDEKVKALFERVKKEQGHLEILVNNAWVW